MKKAERKGRKSDNSVYAIRLTRARKAAGYTQAKAAQELGIDEETLRMFERGNQAPPAPMAVTIARQFGTSVEAIYG